MINFMNYLFMNQCFFVMIWIWNKFICLKTPNQQNAAYDTEDLKFQPYIVFPLGEKSKIKIEYSIEKQI